MDKSQSLFLAAVILSGQKPNPPGVLRSSLYPILDDKDGLLTTKFKMDNVAFMPTAEDGIKATQHSLDLIELRTTQIKYVDEDVLIASKLELLDITLRSSLIKYVDTNIDSTVSTKLNLDAITLTRVLIAYKEQDMHTISSTKFNVDVITLSTV